MSNQNSNKLIGKWLINTKIENKTPIIIGTGKQAGWVDIEVIKDEKGNFYIPATSFKGALRHFLEENYEIPENLLNLFFGSQNQQAIATFFDLKTKEKTNIKVRDGVAIDIKTNIAKEGAKYDYEVVEPEHEFEFKIEITLFSDIYSTHKNDLLQLIATIKKVLENQNERFAGGAMTTKGFGILKANQFKFFTFDFNDINDSKIWIQSTF